MNLFEISVNTLSDIHWFFISDIWPIFENKQSHFLLFMLGWPQIKGLDFRLIHTFAAKILKHDKQNLYHD